MVFRAYNLYTAFVSQLSWAQVVLAKFDFYASLELMEGEEEPLFWMYPIILYISAKMGWFLLLKCLFHPTDCDETQPTRFT